MNKPWITFDKWTLCGRVRAFRRLAMIDQPLPFLGIEVYDLANRRLYAKTDGRAFALFEDELSPEELIAIAWDIARRRAQKRNTGK